MHRLMLLRHAKSDWPAGVADRERPLAPRGRRDAGRMAEEMALRGLVPDLALVSPALRTRQTFELAAPALKHPAHREAPTIYEAEPEAILALVRKTDEAVRSLLVVGHNPGLEHLAAFLVGGGPGRLRERMGEKFPTAALAAIDFAEDWRTVGEGRGTLDLFLTPSDLD